MSRQVVFAALSTVLSSRRQDSPYNEHQRAWTQSASIQFNGVLKAVHRHNGYNP